ncbi:MAG TPA: hypothetical protein VF859_01335, partial [Burkholderiales bacterium]
YVAPGHCTGEPTFAALRTAFGERYLYAGLGSVIALGPRPGHAEGGADHFGLDEDELAIYRALLAQSADEEFPRLSLTER